MSVSAHAADRAANPLHQTLGAPENWKVSGSFRTRLEAIDGQFRPAVAGDDFLLSFRTTLFAEYDGGPVRIGAELFDSRGYLQKKNSSAGTTEVNALELGQAYLGFDLDDRLGDGSSSAIMVGRFTQDIGSRRLVARNQFRNTINAFTGIRFDWQDAAKDELRLFWTMPHNRLPTEAEEIRHNQVEWDRESSDLQFYGASFTKAGMFGGTVELYGYGLHERDAPSYPTRNRRLFTPGIRFARAPRPDRFDYDFEGIYQTGQARATTGAADRTDLDVSAYFIHVEIGRSFAGGWSPRLVLQYDRASGDGPNSASYNRFDTLFGARRSEYGPTSLYGAIARANFSAPAVRLEMVPDKSWDGFVAYRPLWLEDATDSFSGTGVRDRRGTSGKFAGHQIEARARYWLIPKLARLDGGIAYLAKGRFLKDAPNAPDGDDTRYAYLDLTFTF
ncbi:alginate export family protein [Sphingomonas oleivorans]|uniref:Alginate export family protein n=2 Tax=Sphingomonas oleivorans TaxID=1735121 RepID=A0A2T5G0E2_9SPHN|nr:alginate export family protein [Sphingomonas oleivorans]